MNLKLVRLLQLSKYYEIYLSHLIIFSGRTEN